MSFDEGRYREIYEDISGAQVMATGTGDTTLVTVKASHTIYIQRLKVQLTTGSSGKTWSFEDSANTPISISGALDAATAPASYELFFGAEGVPLTEAKNFVLNVSAAGAAGQVTWQGYQKLTAVAAA